MQDKQRIDFTDSNFFHCITNSNPKEIYGVKGLIIKLLNNCGIIYAEEPLNCYTRFDNRDYGCRMRKSLLTTDLKVNDKVFLNAITEPTCCSLYYVTKVWKALPHQINTENRNEMNSGHFNYATHYSKTGLHKSSIGCIKKFGYIEALKAHHGFINFEGRNEAVYFSVNDVQDFESPVSDLRDVLFKGQSVRFSAVHNVTNINWAKWRALEVWSRILEDVTQKDLLGYREQHRKLNGKINFLNGSYGHIIFEKSGNYNFAYFCPDDVKNVVVTSPLEDFLEIGQHVNLTVAAPSTSNNEMLWNATSVWIKLSCFSSKNIDENLTVRNILKDASHIRNAKGKLFPALNTEGTIRVFENISLVVNVSSEVVYRDNKRISNFVDLKSGTDICADCIQLPEFGNCWVALTAWIGERPQNIGFSAENIADEIRKVKKIYATKNEQPNQVENSQDLKGLQRITHINEMGDTNCTQY